MDFRFTAEQDKFRQEIRDYLDGEIKKGGFTPVDDCWVDAYSREFSLKIGAQGWIGMTWPKEYGGQGRNYLDRLILTEELLRYGAPVAGHWVADRQIGPSIIHYGNETQKRDILPHIIKGELVFALGMSEPQAGSDLASLQTKAVEQGDNYVIDGQKVWTSGAHISDYVYLVARTDPNVAKHKGISEFLMDLKLPGVTIRPIINMLGDHHFNEVFFDSVKVPKTMLIGEKNRGWYQIAAQLDYERSGLERLMSNYRLFHDLVAFIRERHEQKRDPPRYDVVKSKIAELQLEFDVGRLLTYRVASVLSEGKTPNYEAALAKDYCTMYMQRVADGVTSILGLYGQVMPGSKVEHLGGRAARGYIFSRAYTLAGGTNEVLKSIVAMRGLGLPAS